MLPAILWHFSISQAQQLWQLILPLMHNVASSETITLAITSLWIMLSYTIKISWTVLLYAVYSLLVSCVIPSYSNWKVQHDFIKQHLQLDLPPCKCIYLQFLCFIDVTLLIWQYDICCNSPPILSWMHGPHAVLDGCQPWPHIICVMSFYYVFHVVLGL